MANERKRGEKLEVAILEAADEIIQTSGYGNLTFQNIAKQAKTSRTVIYRRYETPVDLLYALVRYKSQKVLGGDMIDLLEERGSLRTDLIAAMKLYQQFFEALGSEIMNALLFEWSQGNEAARAWISRARESNLKLMKKVQELAKRRGEIQHEFSSMQMILPFDILRLQNLINSKSVTVEYITQLVDEVLMPVYSGGK